MICSWKKLVVFVIATVLAATGIGFSIRTHTLPSVRPDPIREPIQGMADNICGPRCVQFVLRQYGFNAELQELVREVQWPALEEGATLDSMTQALQRRGICTCVLKLDPSTRLAWRYPVIIHLRGNKGFLGHYLVLLPRSGTDEADEYVEFTGVSHYPSSAIHERMSGVVMLTSPVPIDDWRSAISGEPLSFLFAPFVLFALFLFGILMLPTVWRKVARS